MSTGSSVPMGSGHVILPALAFLEALNHTYLPFNEDFMEEGWLTH